MPLPHPGRVAGSSFCGPISFSMHSTNETGLCPQNGQVGSDSGKPAGGKVEHLVEEVKAQEGVRAELGTSGSLPVFHSSGRNRAEGGGLWVFRCLFAGQSFLETQAEPARELHLTSPNPLQDPPLTVSLYLLLDIETLLGAPENAQARRGSPSCSPAVRTTPATHTLPHHVLPTPYWERRVQVHGKDEMAVVEDEGPGSRGDAHHLPQLWEHTCARGGACRW